GAYSVYFTAGPQSLPILLAKSVSENKCVCIREDYTSKDPERPVGFSSGKNTVTAKSSEALQGLFLLFHAGNPPQNRITP
ncbi:MAG: hypothetical protein ACOX2G_13275, partial [Bacillota bacterium]